MAVPWSSSFELMLLGMGSIFVFLTFLVIAVTIMSAVIGKISPAESSLSAAPSSTAKASLQNESNIVAAAAAAYAASRNASSSSSDGSSKSDS